jgi:hypothetical protein
VKDAENKIEEMKAVNEAKAEALLPYALLAAVCPCSLQHD